MIEDDIKAVKIWAKEHNVEINFSDDGNISLWADAGGANFTIDDIKGKSIESAVVSVEEFRKSGWKIN